MKRKEKLCKTLHSNEIHHSVGLPANLGHINQIPDVGCDELVSVMVLDNRGSSRHQGVLQITWGQWKLSHRHMLYTCRVRCVSYTNIGQPFCDMKGIYLVTMDSTEFYSVLSWLSGFIFYIKPKFTFTHCGLITPYSKDLGHDWPRHWFIAWWHQAIT